MDTKQIISLITPILLHQAVTVAVSFLFAVCADRYGLEYQATLVVLIGNLLVIPPAVQMYRKDKRSEASPGTTVHGRTASSGITMSGGMLVLFGILCFVGGGVLNIAWSSVLNLLRLQTRFSNQTQEQLFAANLVLQMAGLGIVIPVAEELIFRGLTYRRMRRIFPVWSAVLLSALLFALYHGNPIQMIFAFPMAVVLALVYEHGKLFVFPILFHMGSNLTAIFLQLLPR